MVTSEEVLRRLTLADPTYIHSLVRSEAVESLTTLDARSAVLVQLGGLIANGAPTPIWQQCVSAGSGVGLSPDDIIYIPAFGSGRYWRSRYSK